MAILDLLLNLAGLLLWLGWKAGRADRTSQVPALSLASTLRRASRPESRPWRTLIALAFLLVARSLVYWQLGPPTEWTPSVHMGVVSPRFRPDLLTHMLLFSGLSFLRIFVIVYLWAILLAMCVSRVRGPGGTPQLMVEALLGRLVRWPWIAFPLIVPVAGALLWMALSRLLNAAGILDSGPLGWFFVQQSIAFGLSLLLAWTLPAALLILVHSVNSYVYLGENAWWSYAAAGGRNLVKWLPLAIGRVDLAPLFCLALLITAHFFAERGLLHLFQTPLR